jgi:Zn-dependent protease with chaperone function
MVVPGLFLGWVLFSWIRGARLPRISTAVAVFVTSLATYLFDFILARSDVGSGPAVQVWMNFLWWAVPGALPAAAWAVVGRWNRRRESRQ